MAIVPLNGSFQAGSIPSGAGSFGPKPLLALLDNTANGRVAGGGAARFLIGHANVTNVDSGAQTFDLQFQANLLYPSINNSPTNNGA